jgi:polyisoprenoid-binding protein YceI
MTKAKMRLRVWLLVAALGFWPQTEAAQQTAAPAAKEVLLSVDAAQSKAHFAVDTTLHDVHGTFNVSSGRIEFDPQTGKADGAIVVFATSGDTGNGSRDEKMHKEVLESAKFPEATFKPTRVEGTVSLSGASEFKLRGVLKVHGGEHEVVADVHAEFSTGHWKGTAKFDVPFIEWKMKDPSNFLLKVKPIVHVEVELAGEVK